MAAAGAGMNNFTTLIKRLEAATSRLEDLASSAISDAIQQMPTGGVPQSSSAPDLPATAQSAAIPSKSAAPEVPRVISELDELVDGDLMKFMEAANAIGGVVAEQAKTVCQAVADQRTFLLVSTKAKKPDMTSPQFPELIKDLQQRMVTVNETKEQNRDPAVKDHLSMVAEGLGVLQWLVLEDKPADFVGDILGGAQFWGNKVLKTHKDGDQTQVSYVQSYYALLKAHQTFIKQHYPSGVTWNKKGVDAIDALKEIRAQSSSEPKTNGVSEPPPAPAASSGGPPPPPPMPTFEQLNPPGPPPPPAAKSANGGAGSIGDVFDQLNRGEAVTAGLKKVDKSQMTHKNPSLRASGTVPDRNGSDDSLARSRSKGPETKPKPPSMRQNSTIAPSKREGRKELDGNKWLIEHFEEPQQPITLDVSLTQSVLISRCKDTTIILKGKANAISIDNCSRTSIVIDSLVSSVDVIKCPNFALQVLGALPTVLLDQVDGASIYLSPQSLHTEIFSSKCSSVNVNLPPAKEEDDYRERPLPEQMRTFVRDGQLVTEIVDHAG